jgi:DNA polymerase III subunit delta'
MFKKIIGQDRVTGILKRAVELEKTANSYLFSGPEGTGKFTSALYFGMAVNCSAVHEKRPCGICPSCKKFLGFSHPDFIFLFPTPNWEISTTGNLKSEKFLKEYEEYINNKINTPWKEFLFSGNVEIRINSIRMLEHRINLSPNEANYKICIIENADMMNNNTSNAFLKTLEEPPEDTIIILTSSNPNALLPTILSRCQKIPFQPIHKKYIEKELEEKLFIENYAAKMFARIANGSMEKALRLADEGNIKEREKVIEFVTILLEQDDLKFMVFANHYRTNKTKTELGEIISHLKLWITDISYLQNSPEDLVNLDKTEIIETLYNQNPNTEDYILVTLEFLDEMMFKLKRNVNPSLIFIEIYNRLKKIFF